MLAEDVSLLWESITILEAQKQLKELIVADWPNMKPSERKKFHRDLFSKAYPDEIQTKQQITVADLKKIMGMNG